MLEQAKANGLLVPLRGYKVHVCGASMRGLSPQAWNIVKGFWAAYFQAAGADFDQLQSISGCWSVTHEEFRSKDTIVWANSRK